MNTFFISRRKVCPHMSISKSDMCMYVLEDLWVCLVFLVIMEGKSLSSSDNCPVR